MNARVTIVAPADAQRISAIAARLQSEHDGEALTAARMLVAQLDRFGLRIGDVVAIGLAPAPVVTTITPGPPPRRHHELARECLRRRSLYDDVEVDFLLNVGGFDQLTSRQASWLKRLAARAVRDAA